jgi:hypothetical protein
MLRLIAVCLGAAGLSLLLPSEPSYDPWAWLVWGRELTHLHLDTTAGPSWKPLPVAFTALVAPLGDDLPPALWMVVARAGALLALAFAFRLAARLASGPLELRVAAGVVAAAAVALTPDWFQFAAHGSEAPLAVALMMWAVERHLDRRYSHAFVLAVLVCLMRPELFPFLGVYALWLWAARPGLRALVAGLMVLVPLAWLLPEWVGSGDPLGAGHQARSEPFWSLSHAERPWLRALQRVHNHAGLAVELLALVGVVAAIAGRGRSREQRTVLVLAGAAAVQAGMYVAMTQAGFSGNPRYVLPALVIACVLAGVGTGYVLTTGTALGRARVGRARPSRALTLAGAALAAVAIVVLGAPSLERRVERLDFEAREVGRRMDLHRDLATAIDAIGGPDAFVGSVTANRALRTHLAWAYGHSLAAVEKGHGAGVVFASGRRFLAGEVDVSGHARRRVQLAREGSLRAYRRERIDYPAFTRRLQGFHIQASNGRKPGSRVVTR